MYSWENIVVQDSYLKSEVYNKTETYSKTESDDSFVHKTGDETISDIKTFIGKSAQDPLEAHMIIKNLKDDFRYSNGTKFYYTSFRDKNNKECGWMGYNHTDKSSFIELGARKTPLGNLVTTLEVGFDDDGNAYTYAPKPTEDTTASRQLDTVGARNTKLQNYQEKETAINYNNISNCITEIPQDIKLELNNGTLTLKAGSKLYVPNGAGVFDEIIIDSDKSIEFQSWGSNTRMFFYNPTTDNFTGNIVTYTTSGSSVSPSSLIWVWYDTTNNLVKRTENLGSTWVSGWTLPICICSNVQNTSSSIDQVFNGFGYIGSTIFALPGVKGLIPDGRNEDGTLKSVEITLDTVLTATPGNGDFDFYIKKESIGWSYTYHKDINFNTLSTDKTALRAFAQAGHYKKDSSGITSFTTKTPFHTVDYNDTEFIGHQAMPSGRYINLTLGASGTTYTAPADGWIILSKRVTATGQYITIQANGYVDVGVGYANGGEVSTMIFVKKGAVAIITYSAGGTLERFRFIYAEGSK